MFKLAKAAVLVGLPLADVAEVDVFALHGDEWDPAQLEPCPGFGLDHLGVLAARADAGRAVALLLDLGRAAKDDGDEEAKVLSSCEA